MRSTDVIALRVDDIVPLGCPVNGWLRLVVDGKTVANARAARSGDHLACQIVHTLAHPEHQGTS
jgi:flagellar motor switch/type III secretory pathway protein FliN